MEINVKRTKGFHLNTIHKIEIPELSSHITEYIENSLYDGDTHLAIASFDKIKYDIQLDPIQLELGSMYIYIFNCVKEIGGLSLSSRPNISRLLKDEFLDKWYKQYSRDHGICGYIKVNNIAINRFEYSHVTANMSVIEFKVKNFSKFNNILTCKSDTPMSSSEYYYTEVTDHNEINNLRRRIEGKLKYLL